MDRTSGTGTNKFHVKVIRNLDRFVLCDEVIFLTWEYINLVHSHPLDNIVQKQRKIERGYMNKARGIDLKSPPI